jgi:hypothetical protein
MHKSVHSLIYSVPITRLLISMLVTRDPEDGISVVLRNVCMRVQVHTVTNLKTNVDNLPLFPVLKTHVDSTCRQIATRDSFQRINILQIAWLKERRTTFKKSLGWLGQRVSTSGLIPPQLDL